jgi:tRNA(Ile)-lysidine synthase
LNFPSLHAIIRRMDDLLRRVRRDARRYDLWRAGDTIVAGVSGGPDSLCLLHLLTRLAPEFGLHLHVAHLNHGLRGADADADAAAVAAQATAWQLPCTVGHADVTALAVASGRSIEEAARHARYQFLVEVAAALTSIGARLPRIAVAHNADDQAETVLMHFLRGSGVAGLRGMLPVTPLAEWVPWRAGETGATYHVIRPLLAIPRVEIEAYCAHHGLQPRRDDTNADTTIYRNRLRHELLPILAQYNPAIREVLGHTAAVLAADEEVFGQSVDAAWARVLLASAEGETPDRLERFPVGEIQLDLMGWRSLPLGLQRATVRRAIRLLRSNLRNINWEHVETAVWLGREGETGQQATLPAGLTLEVGYSALRIGAAGGVWTADAPQLAGPLALAAPGVTSIGGGWAAVVRGLTRTALPQGWDGGADPWTAYLDADAVGASLILRPYAAGERFAPQGQRGHSAKISEYMINVKVPRDRRAGWPLLVGLGGPAWLCGLRLDERAIVRPETTTIWEVRIMQANGPSVV